jgi:hypothetical protein
MTESPTPSLLKLVNMSELLDRVDNDRELLQELFELFRVEFPRLQIELKEAVSSKDMQKTANAAHVMKGMLANLSFEGPAAAVGGLEHMAVMGDQPGTERALASFGGEVESLLPSLDAFLAEQMAQRSGLEL